jgi:hypothetical protein
MVRSKILTVVKRTSTKNIYLTASEEARICLNCPLPAKSCNTMSCQRFDEEKKKLKEQKTQCQEKKPRKSTSTH